MRMGRIEFRYSQGNQRHELVRWDETNKFLYVVAFFDKEKEGYDMRTVGDRFFEDHDAWIVGKHALAFLNETFREEE